MRMFTLTLLLLISGGCCLEAITVMAEVDAKATDRALIGLARPSITFDFDECCPSREQKRLAQVVRAKTVDAFEAMVDAGATDDAVDQYNRIAEAAEVALRRVVYVCRARDDPSIPLEKVATVFEPVGASSVVAAELRSWEDARRRFSRDEVLDMLEEVATANLRAVAEAQ